MIKESIPPKTFNEIKRAKELLEIINTAKNELNDLGYDISNVKV
ncbi:hypothetical protein JM84_1570 [Dokdonia sp. Hel_I_63]|nr:hypothetical protein [Dokdonia sp. Hel_I_63]TVZ22662.1 hypothetical protein JM84_1570 [Dokdonia sp. Hel_I_63]